jgi:hypothetical protein
VLCSEPHDAEVVASVRLDDVKARPSTTEAWVAALGSECQRQASAYVGGSMPSHASATWTELEQASWEAGERETECMVATFDAADEPVVTTGSVEH